MRPEQNINKKEQRELIKNENVVLIETPIAIYRIIYGIHTVPENPRKLGKNPKCLVLETGRVNYSTAEAAEELAASLEKDIQYKEIVESAKQRRMPLYLVDISDGDLILTLQHSLGALESAAGAVFLSLLVKEEYSFIKDFLQKKITRREFLKRLLKISAYGYFSIPLLCAISSFVMGEKIDEKDVRRVINRFLVNLDEKTHPEINIVLLTLRNYLMAQKIETIAQMLAKEEKGRKPEIAIVVGDLHTGIEKALKESAEERIRIIEMLSKIPGLSDVRERIATIARLDFDGEGWKATIFKDPALLPLESVNDKNKSK